MTLKLFSRKSKRKKNIRTSGKKSADQTENSSQQSEESLSELPKSAGKKIAKKRFRSISVDAQEENSEKEKQEKKLSTPNGTSATTIAKTSVQFSGSGSGSGSNSLIEVPKKRKNNKSAAWSASYSTMPEAKSARGKLSGKGDTKLEKKSNERDAEKDEEDSKKRRKRSQSQGEEDLRNSKINAKPTGKAKGNSEKKRGTVDEMGRRKDKILDDEEEREREETVEELRSSLLSSHTKVSQSSGNIKGKSAEKVPEKIKPHKRSTSQPFMLVEKKDEKPESGKTGEKDGGVSGALHMLSSAAGKVRRLKSMQSLDDNDAPKNSSTITLPPQPATARVSLASSTSSASKRSPANFPRPKLSPKQKYTSIDNVTPALSTPTLNSSASARRKDTGKSKTKSMGGSLSIGKEESDGEIEDDDVNIEGTTEGDQRATLTGLASKVIFFWSI